MKLSPQLRLQEIDKMSLRSRIFILFPFDMGLELDFTGKDAASFFKEISARKMGSLSFEGVNFEEAEFSTQVYRFGVGMMQISFETLGDLNYLARISCNVEKIKVGKTGIISYCQASVESLMQRANKYATYHYEYRLKDTELFPIFLLKDPPSEDADAFIKKNIKPLFGLVVGEADYDNLSSFVLEQQELINYGYYENDIILIKRFGAVVYSQEADDIVEMIKLSFAQYWSMRSYNYILDHELDISQKHLENLPPYYKFWLIPSAYQRLSSEALDFDGDKISIVDSLYNVLANIPKVESDWHLRTVYQNVNTVFEIEDLHKTVETKIDKIEESYNSARDFLSTNFFILLDIIFVLSLVWSIIDTYFFWKISQK
ncbi:MAG: hypothetical protein LHV68_08280 [Elusimicrobia bacterium]|nr:hypothetical protein [Candidatus Liberimonas magnetica]